MTRAEFAAILFDLVRRGAIAESDALTVLDRFDAGELTDLPAMITQQQDNNEWVLALVFVLALVGGSTVRTLSSAQKRRAQRLLRLRFEDTVSQLATGVTSGGLVADWQRSMQTVITDYAQHMAVAGAGTLPRATVQSAVNAQLAGQWPYLTAFAVTLTVGRLVGNMLSEATIAARSTLYGATGWGAYWRGAEPEGYGQIVYYDAVDDAGTCGPCTDAERGGPYLVGSNYPRPGEVCLGRGRCRCTLRFVYDPEVYKRLTG